MATLVIKTVKSSGGDYSSRSAFEAAQQGNLVTADEVRRAEIYSFSDTTACIIDGSTTDATRYMEFVVATGERHAGKWNTSKARLEVTTGFVYPYDMNDNYIRIIGDQVYRNSSSGTRSGILCRGTGCRVDSCIVKATSSTTTDAGINLDGDAASLVIVNNIVYDVGSTGAGIYMNFAVNPRLYNNTVKDCAYGFRSAQARTYFLTNNLADNCSSGGFVQTSGTITANYNASSDATADDFGGTGNRVSQTFTFVDAANDDFHLASGDAGAKTYGTDLSADATYAFSTDIDGDTRSGTWDIGADEVGASAHVVSIGQTSETDTSQTLTRIKAKALGQNSESDSALAVTARKTKAVGQVAEADAAQPLSSSKLRALGQVSESDTALSVSRIKLRALAIAEEIDSALQVSFAGQKTVLLGQVSETDSVTAVTRVKHLTPGQVLESDSAITLSRLKYRALAIVVEVDQALSVSLFGVDPIFNVVERDARFQLARTVDVRFAVTRNRTAVF